MGSITEFLINWGNWGMLLAAFLAGSFLPFSSEAVMLGLLAAGLKPWPLVFSATIGNVMGGLFNYSVGRLGRLDWIEKYLHVSPENLNRATKFMGGRGAWMGFFGFIPFLGSAITIALGLMRANFFISTISMSMGKFLRYVILILSVASLTSCTGGKVDNQRTIMVSIEPLRYFTEQIAGDKFKVITMVPKGGNPETYEPTPKQMMELSKSDLFLKIGNIGFERTWMKKLIANAPHTIMVDTSDGIAPVKTLNGFDDPHTWMSATNARIIAINIFNKLKEIDSRDSLYFKQNLENLLDHISMVDNEVREHITQEKANAFLIYHPILTYFARDYGLTQIPVEEEGHEPSAAQLQQVIRLAKQKQVKVIFVQKEIANRNLNVVAAGVAAKQSIINPLGYHWDQEMVHIAKLLK
ncbi:ABC transporter, substrate-binding protein [Prevotella sp. DNF00663]|uniref:metal ABC transporter solute-binding protein, Zn/Mn family n=1 Tax=unclassified Prevotella TaxID=2638335 RepID=UPI0005143828|nr:MULTISPECIES: zinc ABC transporter substrate-binding protein [unclassified Prevotella]KGI61447.1 ABC transporter substrate-binding protein [Prevotella sp. S7 MS 2]KXB85200.1 ABC transporter, substrate-binding protein [Prevotella sp. DNF00663]